MKRIVKYNCLVTMLGGKLHKCVLKADGSPDMWAGSFNWQEVKAPVTQEFLDAVNSILGASFTLANFSRGKALSAEDAVVNSLAQTAQSKVILLIEDDVSIRESLTIALESQGYKVFSEGDGKAAIEALPRIPKPFLILLDLMMPVMTGWEFVEALKKDAQHAGIPIVAITAFADALKNIKFQDVVKKPVDLDVLFKVVAQA